MNSPDPWDPIVLDPSGAVIWPRAFYRRAFQQEVPSWPTMQSGETRGLFDGAFVAGDAAIETGVPMTTSSRTNGPDRTGLTAEIAPIVAPATGGVRVRKAVDDRQVLHVEICVDGKCYSSSMDLAPALAMVTDKLAQWHSAQHAQMAPTAVSGTVGAATDEAADGMVAALIGRHVDCACGGWLDDIGHAVKSAASGVEHGVSFTIKKLKGPIAKAAAAAATAGATAIPGVGPVVAPMAGKLANDLVNSTLGDASAKKSVVAAKQQAQTDPDVALALDLAQKAVATSTVAHHVHHTARHAAQGHPQAQQQIAQVVADAQGGDPAAQSVMDLISHALGGSLPPVAPVASGWYDIVGAAIDDVRSHALALASTNNASVVGVIRTARGVWKTRGFRDADAADDWLGHVAHDPSSYTYAAIYDKVDVLWPHPLNEMVGTAHATLSP